MIAKVTRPAAEAGMSALILRADFVLQHSKSIFINSNILHQATLHLAHTHYSSTPSNFSGFYDSHVFVNIPINNRL
jgi:hypothetical protein